MIEHRHLSQGWTADGTADTTTVIAMLRYGFALCLILDLPATEGGYPRSELGLLSKSRARQIDDYTVSALQESRPVGFT